MKLIELHFDEKPYSLNVDYIAAICPKTADDGCEIYMVGDRMNEYWNSDESYDEVLRMIKEATNGNEA